MYWDSNLVLKLGQIDMIHSLSGSFASTQPYHAASRSKNRLDKRHNRNTGDTIKVCGEGLLISQLLLVKHVKVSGIKML